MREGGSPPAEAQLPGCSSLQFSPSFSGKFGVGSRRGTPFPRRRSGKGAGAAGHGTFAAVPAAFPAAFAVAGGTGALAFPAMKGPTPCITTMHTTPRPGQPGRDRAGALSAFDDRSIFQNHGCVPSNHADYSPTFRANIDAADSVGPGPRPDLHVRNRLCEEGVRRRRRVCGAAYREGAPVRLRCGQDSEALSLQMETGQRLLR